MNRMIKKVIFHRFRKKELKIHTLSYLFWECTSGCNLNCLHCGSDCSKNHIGASMSLDDFLYAVDTIPGKSKNMTVVLTGGEPLLRTDIELCGMEIRRRGMRWGMVSNGYLYDREKHISLLNAGLGALTISLDGLEENHNWLRNSNDSFVRADAAIILAASSSRLNFDVVTAVNQKNIHELPLIFQYLVSRGVRAWRLFTIIPIGRAKNRKELFLNDSQFKELLDFISMKRKQGAIDIKFSCEGYTGNYELKVRDSFFFCRAGINIGSILSDGSISACPNIDRKFIQGNIYRDNFFEIWQNKFETFRDRSWTGTGKCEKCTEYKECLGGGIHNRRGRGEDVLVCHNEMLRNAIKSCNHAC